MRFYISALTAQVSYPQRKTDVINALNKLLLTSMAMFLDRLQLNQ